MDVDTFQHRVTMTYTNAGIVNQRDTHITAYEIVGTKDQIAAHVTKAVTNALEHGRTPKIEFVPIPPWNIVTLADRDEA